MKSDIQTFFRFIQLREKNFLRIKAVIVILILGNFLGAVIGFLYYFDVIGLTQYSPILWILIPDCPMAVLLLLGVYIQKNKQDFANYNFFVFIQGIRGAMLTFLMISFFESIDIEIVVIGHSLLMIQAILILPLLADMELNRGTIIVIVITFLNDISDFFGLFGLFYPTLTQLQTIQSLYPFFVIAIFGLDITLILAGIGFTKLMGSAIQEHSLSKP